jgi:hypothetical protein
MRLSLYSTGRLPVINHRTGPPGIAILLIQRVLGALWELPQNALGAGVLVVTRALGRVQGLQRDRGRLFIETRGLGVSLGWFIFWSREFAPGFASADKNRDHEYGHSVQSRWLGPAYLVVVGLPSVSRVIYSVVYYRLRGRPWMHYYDGWPEKQADRLGGVRR